MDSATFTDLVHFKFKFTDVLDVKTGREKHRLRSKGTISGLIISGKITYLSTRKRRHTPKNIDAEWINRKNEKKKIINRKTEPKGTAARVASRKRRVTAGVSGEKSERTAYFASLYLGAGGSRQDLHPAGCWGGEWRDRKHMTHLSSSLLLLLLSGWYVTARPSLPLLH